MIDTGRSFEFSYALATEEPTTPKASRMAEVETSSTIISGV